MAKDTSLLRRISMGGEPPDRGPDVALDVGALDPPQNSKLAPEIEGVGEGVILALLLKSMIKSPSSKGQAAGRFR